MTSGGDGVFEVAVRGGEGVVGRRAVLEVVQALGNVGAGHPAGEGFDGGGVIAGDSGEGVVGIEESVEDASGGFFVGVEEDGAERAAIFEIDVRGGGGWSD